MLTVDSLPLYIWRYSRDCVQRLPTLIGTQMARELAYTGRTLGAEEAAALGLTVRTYVDRAALDAGVADVAAAIASKSPITIRGVKQALLFSRDHSVDDSLQQVKLHNAAMLHSADLQEAFRAAVARDAPTWDRR